MAESSSRSVAESKQARTARLGNRGQQLVLDLRDVTLVNQDAVEFLAGCEADSIKLISESGSSG
jgi:hypothetical protein